MMNKQPSKPQVSSVRSTQQNVRRVLAHAAVLLGMVQLLLGCQLLGGVQVEPVATSTQKPSNVAVYLSVQNGDEAVYGLSQENFKVYENEVPLDSNQIGLRLLDRDVAVSHHVVVLVDLSGSAQDDGALTLLASQLAPFVERLRDKYHVALYGFDGSDELTPLGNFAMLNSKNPGKPVSKEDLSALTGYVQKDSSSNLNGAVIKGLSKVNEHVGSTNRPISLGSMVIVARGPDLAARTKQDALLTALDNTKHQVFAVTVGTSEDTDLAELLGPAGYAQTRVFENLENSLADVASMVERDHSRYYLLSYCSPARSGDRTVMVEMKKLEGSGDTLEGKTEITFNATGFTSGCDAGAVPLFGKAAVAASAPAPTPAPTTETAGDTEAAAPGEQSAPSEQPATATEEPVPPPATDTYAQ